MSTLQCLNQVQARTHFSVLQFGACADGKTDNSKAFMAAWNQACNSLGENGVLIPTGACNSLGENGVLIPTGVFLLRPVVFRGPCKGSAVFQIRGVLKAPTDKASLLDHWISFKYIDQLMINDGGSHDGGSLDGEGASAGPLNNCSKDPNCPPLLVNITISRIRISAPEDSPNTDGIHLGSSTDIRILYSFFGTGDDCISMGPAGSKNININNVHCGLGHGISIGSLGGSKMDADVTEIVQIKLRDVSNPIFIDEQHCPSRTCDQKIRGVLKAPTDKASLLDHWISFKYINQLMINDGGSLDGEGASAGPLNNFSKGPNCPPLLVSMRLDFITNSRMSSITSINSKNFHFNIFACKNITISRIRISAPEDSPNTDGIHLGSSTDIRILDSFFGTGDDCISMGPGSKNININNVHCGLGHGISIGSLGGSKMDADVTEIVVRNCSLVGTSNGIRIKTCAPSYQAEECLQSHFH
ncbi:hypothetical protein SLEP1_g51054 [Rubroshorea leprosula]|uniref:Polygalacturonase n=1 Tax=Rubroshorea leprosula TaxID=152421 RepID=A0AAV5M272_9ROSI|nr:hypothetical protein SLEP1_g51054 [Rubroshorea leprosula]